MLIDNNKNNIMLARQIIVFLDFTDISYEKSLKKLKK